MAVLETLYGGYYFLDVPWDADLSKGPAYDPVCVDYEGRPLHSHVLPTVHTLFDPCAVGFGDRVIDIRYQRKIQLMFLGELLM